MAVIVIYCSLRTPNKLNKNLKIEVDTFDPTIEFPEVDWRKNK